jgi:4-diphosphocytidyl-2-C-methyl-D-erythritol kinase
MKRTVVLVKPEGGVSTAAAYHAFDEGPAAVPPEVAINANEALCADDLQLFNNLAPAAEQLMPELADVRDWLEDQPGVEGALLCGSGATTFAVCDAFATATRIVADARQRGWWARVTSFAPIRAQVVATADGSPVSASASEQAVRS